MKKGAEAPETQSKDTKLYQLQQIQIAFFSHPKTMMQASRQVGIDRANTCRYVAEMRKAEAIWPIRKGICPITKHSGVVFYSTNSKYAENLPQQAKLF